MRKLFYLLLVASSSFQLSFGQTATTVQKNIHATLQVATPESAGVSSERLKRIDANLSAWVQNGKTNGCVALTDEEIEQIWSVVPIGTPVEIKP